MPFNWSLMVMYAVVFIFEILSSLTEFFFLEKQQRRQRNTKFVLPKETSNNMSENLYILLYSNLTLNAPIATKAVCFSRLLIFLRSLYDKQCGPSRSSLFGLHAVCFYT